MSTNEHLTRYRFHFEKNENMKYTGHLDLHRTLERTFRRSTLPLAYSQGFNPMPGLLWPWLCLWDAQVLMKLSIFG